MYQFYGVMFIVSTFRVCATVAQQPPSASPHATVAPGAPASFAQKLRGHNVPLTKPALVAALGNPDPEVRSLAAAELAEEGAEDTRPAIETALDNEQVPTAKLNIAAALANLGGEQGIEVLKQACAESQNPPSVRMLATRYLLDFGRPSCIGAELEVLQNQSHPDSRAYALALAPTFGRLSPNDKKQLVDLSARALEDSSAQVRISAGDALAKLGDPRATPYLQQAIAKENDKEVRSQLHTYLLQLQAQKGE